ncbi:MAG: triose-phosphate isomerase [Candidatus Methanodesulfokora washburnensis]|jgi:triosephosphate isomerase
MSVPSIIVNFKAFRESMHKGAFEIARAAERVSRETGISIGVAPNYIDAYYIAKNFDIPVLLQHVDPVDFGAYTGQIPVESLILYGFKGSLVNHSERKLRIDEIRRIVSKMNELGLISVVCSSDNTESVALSVLKPSAVAVEPPELIGTGISVSKAKPEVVREAVDPIKRMGNVRVLCGAGITTADDVRKALELGVDGVLLATAVTRSRDPRGKLMELAGAFKF